MSAPQALSGAVAGAWASLPATTPGEPLPPPPVTESARAELPHKDRMPVAAATATTPLLRICRNLVVFLLGEVERRRGREWADETERAP
ncbi:hypothetical protein SGLAM104S_06546 [Streptomyces glaucescens]